ncbi:MAG: WG repeat-containing protein [Alcaligenaceae bacterium]|nr:WG repeat-containing protein [Alcaligenaceae bacterium]
MRHYYQTLLLSIFLLISHVGYAQNEAVYMDYDRVSLHSLRESDLIRVEKDGKIGWIDRSGNQVIPPIYSHMYYFDEAGLAIAEKEGKVGLIDTKGEVRMPFRYDEMKPLKNPHTYQVRLGEKWGVIQYDTSVTTVLPLEYEDIKEEDGYYIVYKNSLFQLVNQQGNMLIPTGFDEIQVMSSEAVLVRIEGRWHFFDIATGKVDEIAYDKVKFLRDDMLLMRQKGDFSVLNGRTRQVVVPVGYAYKDFIGYDLMTVKKDKKIGIFNAKGRMVSPPQYDEVDYFTQGTADVRIGDFWGRIDGTGKLVTPAKYLERKVQSYSEYSAQQTPDKKWHILSEQDGREIGRGFDNVHFMGDDSFVMEQDGHKLLADIRPPHKIITSLDQYDTIRPLHCSGCETKKLIVEQKGQYGLMTTDGQVLIKPQYEALVPWTNVNMLFKQGGLYGVVDFKGKVEVPAQYDEIEWLDCHHDTPPRGIARRGDSWRFIDIHTQPASDVFTTKIRSIIVGMNYLLVQDRETELYGLMSFAGQEILPPKYTRIIPTVDIIEVFQDEKVAFFNAQGKQLTDFTFVERGYDYSMNKGLLLVTALIDPSSGFRRANTYWVIYDAVTGKKLYTNRKPVQTQQSDKKDKNNTLSSQHTEKTGE